MATEPMYRAKQPLYIDWARAHNEGDLIPEEKVKQFGWENKVEKVSAAEAKAATTATKSEK